MRRWPANFRRHFAARMSSVLGSQATYVAFPLLAIDLFGPAQGALVTAASYGSTSIVGLPAGHWADRHSRRAIMVAAETVQLVSMVALVAALMTEAASVPVVCALSFINGAMHAAFRAASTAAIPDLLDRDALPGALSANESRNALMSVVGPLLGAGLLTVSVWAPFALASVTFAASLVLLSRITTPLAAGTQASHTNISMMASIAQGLRTVAAHTVLRWSLIAQLLLSFVLTGTFFAVMATLSAQGQQVGAGAVAAITGAGLFVGSFLVPALGRRWHPLTAIAAQGVVWAACLAALAISPTLATAAAVTGMMWVIVPAVRVALQT